jgi:hypothetical protein
VATPKGPGAVFYVRNLPPAYATPEAVSVLLDSRKGEPGYVGTMFRADVVAVHEHERSEMPPYPLCHGAPTIADCIAVGYCRRNPNCGE